MLSWIKAFLLSSFIAGLVFAMLLLIMIYPAAVLALLFIVVFVVMTIAFKEELFRGKD